MLFPLMIIGVLAYINVQQSITEQILGDLDSLAAVQEERINEITERSSSVVRDEIIALVSGFTGSSETGEMVLAERDADGDARFLHTRRFESASTALSRVPKERTDIPITQALLKNEGRFVDVVDYREEPTLAVTRYIDRADLGLVIKIDKYEAFRPVRNFQTTLLIAVFALMLLAGALAYFLARSITRPIVALTEGAETIGKGDLEHKIDVVTNDEIGLLAQEFNTMTEQLKESHSGLEQKVKDRTKDLEKFRLAAESASDHIIITDADGTIVYANDAVERITGFSKNDVIGKKAGSKEIWGGLMDHEFYEKLWKTIKIQQRSFSGEIKNKRKNGQEYFASLTISPVVDEAGEVEFFVGIERDITREKRVDRAKTEFVSLASHQLRTPLSSINWYTEMLISGDAGTLNAEQQKYLDEIYHGNQRMVELVNALLNVSRLELGTFMVEPEPVDIIALAQSIIDELRPLIDEKELSVTKQFIESLPTIQADPKLLGIIFQNLLSNAAKYTPEKGSITIAIAQQEKGHTKGKGASGDDCIQIIIRDSGMGIPRHQQDKIFTKLFRADNVRDSDTDGTGLGLYIVKSILDRVGGSNSFESEEGKGTTFEVIFPVSGMKPRKGAKKLS